MKKFFKVILIIFFSSCFLFQKVYSAEKQKLLEVDWSFKGYFGKFDRASLQRGYQVYNEVCASCHSMKYLSYRNLYEKGGPEFSKDQAKIIASQFEVIDGPNNDGEMFKLMSENPKIIERPIIINGNKACIGRPPENILKIL